MKKVKCLSTVIIAISVFAVMSALAFKLNSITNAAKSHNVESTVKKSAANSYPGDGTLATTTTPNTVLKWNSKKSEHSAGLTFDTDYSKSPLSVDSEAIESREIAASEGKITEKTGSAYAGRSRAIPSNNGSQVMMSGEYGKNFSRSIQKNYIASSDVSVADRSDVTGGIQGINAGTVFTANGIMVPGALLTIASLNYGGGFRLNDGDLSENGKNFLSGDLFSVEESPGSYESPDGIREIVRSMAEDRGHQRQYLYSSSLEEKEQLRKLSDPGETTVNQLYKTTGMSERSSSEEQTLIDHPAAVPEPEMFMMFASGILALAIYLKQRKPLHIRI